MNEEVIRDVLAHLGKFAARAAEENAEINPEYIELLRSEIALAGEPVTVLMAELEVAIGSLKSEFDLMKVYLDAFRLVKGTPEYPGQEEDIQSARASYLMGIDRVRYALGVACGRQNVVRWSIAQVRAARTRSSSVSR